LAFANFALSEAIQKSDEAGLLRRSGTTLRVALELLAMTAEI
jgi:hypothetical protein